LRFYNRIQDCLDASQQARQRSPAAPEVFAAAQFRRGGADLRQQGKAVALEIYALFCPLFPMVSRSTVGPEGGATPML
jgi:hypothetical protein